MGGNGQRRPPRPRIELAGAAASPEEAAAVIAAIEQHLAETAAPRREPERSRWQLAALREGVGAKLGAEPPREFGRGWG